MSVADTIFEKLTVSLSPSHIEVINESHNHHVPPNSETHFKVIITSESFEGKRLLARHRAVNEALATEFANGLHALSMHTFSPDELAAEVIVPNSPKCKG